MKLNDFFNKTPRRNSSVPKIITVTNETKEKELSDKISDLEREVERVDGIQRENDVLRLDVTGLKERLQASVQKEQALTNTNGILQGSITEGDRIRSDNQRLNMECVTLTNQVGNQDIMLEQAKKTNLELNITATTLTKQLDDLNIEDANMRRQLDSSLQQTTTSLERFSQMHEQFENTSKMFQATEVKYNEEQRTNSELTRQVTYLTSVANTLQGERDELEQTRKMLKALADNVEADNVETKGAVKITQGELKKLRGTVKTMTTNIDSLVQENQNLSGFNSALKEELSRPKHMSVSAIEHLQGFKLPTGGYRKHFLGNSKPTLLKFKRED